MKIIIQAGGRGTRLEGLTRNKPKCLVPVNNLPILFYAFKKFPDAEFTIIADYKTDVLKKYLAAFGSEYKYRIIQAAEKGTVSGIKTALDSFSDDEAVVVIWCDLILPENFEFPGAKGNYIGIAKDFECRWSFVDGKFVKQPSKDHGVAGLFIFENKSILQNISESGALVGWLSQQDIPFTELPLNGTKEIGTLIAYDENNQQLRRWRPFNSMRFEGDMVIKDGINEQGRKIAVDERNWYRFVKDKGYEFIPEIFEYEPLKMKRVQGGNIYDYDCLTRTQKKDILKNIIGALEQLHDLVPAIPAVAADARMNYIEKTWERLSKVRNLIPFADQEFIRINGRYYRNVFFAWDEFSAMLERFLPEKFKLIHGDCTFSNMMFDTFNMKTVLIDPRGYFGNTKYYGDVDYDWAKLYYSLKGNYDQFNRKKFVLDIHDKDVEMAVKSNAWEDMEEFFFDNVPNCSKEKIKLLHAMIWLSLTTYAWEDYDSVCGAFYNGIIHAGDIL